MQMSLPFSLEQESFFGPDPVESPNVGLVHRLTGPLNLDLLQTAISLLLQRHEGLRIRLTTNTQAPALRIADSSDVILEPMKANLEKLWERIDEVREAPLNLSDEGPIRFRIQRLQPESHILSTTIHPAALDAWGGGIVTQELWALYEGLRSGRGSRLDDLPLSFSDHVRKQHSAGPRLTSAQRDYYLSQLGNLELTTLPWHPSGERAALFTHEEFVLDREAMRRISRVARDVMVTTAAIFLAGFELSLGLASGAETGGLSCIYFGREDAATLGMATSMARRVPLRYEMAPTTQISDFIQQAMQDWAGSVSRSGPPYSSARLLHATGRQLDVFEPVFNQRVTRSAAEEEAAEGHWPDDGNAMEIEWLQGPNARPIPMWPQFGSSAFFALITMGPAPAVTAIYDRREIAESTARTIFNAYEMVMHTIAEGDTRQTIAKLHALANREALK
jgi:hypothetical protein